MLKRKPGETEEEFHDRLTWDKGDENPEEILPPMTLEELDAFLDAENQNETFEESVCAS